jgi:hypothetical protein
VLSILSRTVAEICFPVALDEIIEVAPVVP